MNKSVMNVVCCERRLSLT